MTDNDRMAQLERACSYLRRIPAWYLATTDASDGHQPRVRPFSFAMVDDGKLWFCTSRDKDVWAELSANPKFELSGWKPGECWIVLTGEAALEDDAVAGEKLGVKRVLSTWWASARNTRVPTTAALLSFRSATLPPASAISTAAKSIWSSSASQINYPFQIG